MSFWGQKTFCLVTGASRGIGKTIAIEFAKNVAPGSLFVLLARSEDALEVTKKSLLSATGNKVHVHTASMDLENPNAKSYSDLVSSALQEIHASPASFEHALLVHNAGSLGNIQRRVVEMDDLTEIQNYWTLNVSSMIILTSEFFKIFNDSSKQQRSVVQISSLAGLQPFKTWGYYCAGKACRDMLMKSLSLEEPGIQTLSYAPGPVETDMYDKVCRETGDPEVLAMSKSVRTAGKVLSCETTVTKLIMILGKKEFVKGEHVDYFDDVK